MRHLFSDGPEGRAVPHELREEARPSGPSLNGVELAYAPPLPLHRRRTFTCWTIAAFVLTIAVAGPWWFPPLRRQAALLYWQHRCLTESVPADTVAADFDATDAPPVFAGDGDFHRFYGLLSPPGDRGSPVVFVHERRTPDGRSRLVVVQAYTLDTGAGDMDAGKADTLALSFRARVFRPGGIGRSPTEASVREPGSILVELIRPARVLAGRCDPADASHFTFEGSLGDHPFAVDGWLGDDETVTLQVCRPAHPSRF